MSLLKKLKNDIGVEEDKEEEKEEKIEREKDEEETKVQADRKSVV